MFLLKPLLLLVLIWSANGDSSCPEGCSCDDSSSSISCHGLSAADVRQMFENANAFKSVMIRNCSTPFGRIDEFPKTFRPRSLEISACGISDFGAEAFKFMDDLIELRLLNNSLTSVPFLQNLKKLEILNLNKNLLETIPEGSFNGMEQILQLRLKGNKICKLPSKTFNEIKGSLELLDLGSNCLSAVPASNLRSSIFLKHLDLSGNQIVTVKDLELMNLPDLKEIRLSSNRISQISLRAFVNVPALTHLYVKKNELTAVDPVMLQSFKSLNVIDLSANRLQKIPSFKDMTELKMVYLHENSISRIDTLTFSSNPKLQMISLQDNKIELIARNSFDSLSSLSHLLLSNNALQTIEAGIFDGMPNLFILGLHNNSISELTAASFASLAQLGSLDLSDNRLQKISAGTFAAQKKLFWLDISNNHVTSFENGAFSAPVATILLNGNALICDTSLDWFISYLVQNNIRTFLPHQPEITCAGPPQFANVRIKELMIKKANDTLNSSMKQINAVSNQQQSTNFLANLLPALTQMGASNVGGASGGNVPMLNSLRSLPGMDGILNSNDPANKNLESAIEQFAEPLVRFSTGAQPAASDVSSLIKSIPNLVVNLPGYGNIDIRKVHPKLIEHVLNGGTVPGVPKETMDSLVKQIMQRVYASAAQAQNRPIDPEISRTLPRGGLKPEKYLRPLNELPESFVSSVMQGKPLPYLTPAQTDVVKEYYMQGIPSEMVNSSAPNNMSSLINPGVMKMFNMLPPGYNISRLPKEVIQAVMRGEMPDLTLLPSDLQLYIRDNMDKFVENYGGAGTPDVSVEEILRKLPKFEHSSDMQTFSPYDINEMDSDLVVKNQDSDGNMRLYIAIALGLISTVTLAILIGFCIYVRKQKILKSTGETAYNLY